MKGYLIRRTDTGEYWSGKYWQDVGKIYPKLSSARIAVKYHGWVNAVIIEYTLTEVGVVNL